MHKLKERRRRKREIGGSRITIPPVVEAVGRRPLFHQDVNPEVQVRIRRTVPQGSGSSQLGPPVEGRSSTPPARGIQVPVRPIQQH